MTSSRPMTSRRVSDPPSVLGRSERARAARRETLRMLTDLDAFMAAKSTRAATLVATTVQTDGAGALTCNDVACGLDPTVCSSPPSITTGRASGGRAWHTASSMHPSHHPSHPPPGDASKASTIDEAVAAAAAAARRVLGLGEGAHRRTAGRGPHGREDDDDQPAREFHPATSSSTEARTTDGRGDERAARDGGEDPAVRSRTGPASEETLNGDAGASHVDATSAPKTKAGSASGGPSGSYVVPKAVPSSGWPPPGARSAANPGSPSSRPRTPARPLPPQTPRGEAWERAHGMTPVRGSLRMARDRLAASGDATPPRAPAVATSSVRRALIPLASEARSEEAFSAGPSRPPVTGTGRFSRIDAVLAAVQTRRGGEPLGTLVAVNPAALDAGPSVPASEAMAETATNGEPRARRGRRADEERSLEPARGRRTHAWRGGGGEGDNEGVDEAHMFTGDAKDIVENLKRHAAVMAAAAAGAASTTGSEGNADSIDDVDGDGDASLSRSHRDEDEDETFEKETDGSTSPQTPREFGALRMSGEELLAELRRLRARLRRENRGKRVVPVAQRVADGTRERGTSAAERKSPRGAQRGARRLGVGDVGGGHPSRDRSRGERSSHHTRHSAGATSGEHSPRPATHVSNGSPDVRGLWARRQAIAATLAEVESSAATIIQAHIRGYSLRATLASLQRAAHHHKTRSYARVLATTTEALRGWGAWTRARRRLRARARALQMRHGRRSHYHVGSGVDDGDCGAWDAYETEGKSGVADSFRRWRFKSYSFVRWREWAAFEAPLAQGHDDQPGLADSFRLAGLTNPGGAWWKAGDGKPADEDSEAESFEGAGDSRRGGRRGTGRRSVSSSDSDD